MPRHNMPDNWEPPVAAWSANFGGSVSFAIAYCGVQFHTGDVADLRDCLCVGAERTRCPRPRSNVADSRM